MILTDCFYCKIGIGDLPYRCTFCGMIFCNKHRLPENHNCPFDLRAKDNLLNPLDTLLYQDALEIMDKNLTVARIYDYVTTKQITKSEAIEFLTYFLENSDNTEIRKISIQAFRVLKLKSNKAFKLLESYLISEEDPIVKKIIAEILSHNFPKKSRDLLNWIRSHDKDFH